MKFLKFLGACLLGAMTMSWSAHAAPQVTYSAGYGVAGLQAGLHLDGGKLNQDWQLVYGLQATAPTYSVSADLGAKYKFSFDGFDFAVNPYVHAGVLGKEFDAGAGVAGHFYINDTWGVRLDYRASQHYHDWMSIQLTYRK